MTSKQESHSFEQSDKLDTKHPSYYQRYIVYLIFLKSDCPDLMAASWHAAQILCGNDAHEVETIRHIYKAAITDFLN